MQSWGKVGHIQKRLYDNLPGLTKCEKKQKLEYVLKLSYSGARGKSEGKLKAMVRMQKMGRGKKNNGIPHRVVVQGKGSGVWVHETTFYPAAHQQV